MSDEIDDVLAADAGDEDLEVLAEAFDADEDDVAGDEVDVDVDAFAEDDDDEDGDDDTEQPAGDLAGVDAIGDDEDDEPSSEPAVDLAALEDLDDDAELDDEDDSDDGLKDGEFVCRSCHMAKRASALADPDAMLCRDCV